MKMNNYSNEYCQLIQLIVRKIGWLKLQEIKNIEKIYKGEQVMFQKNIIETNDDFNLLAKEE